MSESIKCGHDVFISYSSKNKNVADAVVADFEQNGIKCWYAPRDILPGEEWVTAITKALEKSKVLVLIYTDESNNSRQVMNEIAVAFNAGITIVPFKLSNEQMSRELEYYLTRVHWLDAVSKPLKENITALREYIDVIIKAPNAALPASAKENKPASSHPDPAKKNKLLMIALVAAIAIIVGLIVGFFAASRTNGNQVADQVPADESAALYDEALTYYSEGNYLLAYDRYIKAADLGSREAMKAAGDMLYDGIGVEMDEGAARELYLKAGGFTQTAAEPYFERDPEGLDDEDMFNRLGLTYFYEYEYEKAVYFFVLSAEEFDSVNCMGNAGIAYENLMDWENTLKWYGAAIDAGHSDSERFKKRIRMMVDDELISEEAAAKWL